jgi:hypothetical protein
MERQNSALVAQLFDIADYLGGWNVGDVVTNCLRLWEG